MRLEKMGDFFAARLEGYDGHMMRDIEGAGEFYPYTAGLLPKEPGARVLDLGCGTGLELEPYFQMNASASVVGIDLSPEMLGELRRKLEGRDVKLIEGSYFDLELGTERFDAAVSVESLHHFTYARKLGLYRRLRPALKPGRYFVLTDYFAPSDEAEKAYFSESERLRREQGLGEEGLYHLDTPLTVDREARALREAGFTDVRVLRRWGATCTVVAVR